MIYLLAIICPGLALMCKGKIFQGILNLLLQITIIGWIPATLHAFAVLKKLEADKRQNEMLKALEKQNSKPVKNDIVEAKTIEYVEIEKEAEGL